eukprot:5802360-Lingulodinium_polyedra.AAC.1
MHRVSKPSKAGEEPEGAPPKAGVEVPKKAYPAGKRLATAEVRQSVQRAPTDKNGKMVCWGSCIWAGCSRTAQDYARSHEPIK